MAIEKPTYFDNTYKKNNEEHCAPSPPFPAILPINLQKSKTRDFFYNYGLVKEGIGVDSYSQLDYRELNFLYIARLKLSITQFSS